MIRFAKFPKMVWIVLALASLVFIGCSGQVQKRFSEPVYYQTRVAYQLEKLPPPLNPMKVSLILEDMSGQYKKVPNVSSFSTAVSQAITEMGVRAALKSPQWFSVLERKGINYLNMERKILQQTTSGTFSPLEAADYVILGGVSQFERDIATGGTGVRLLGIGAATQYAVDSTVVDLRVIDPVNGRVVCAVSASKRIFSYEVRANVFKFVDEDLLEGEIGGDDIEPADLCVREAIEKAMFMVAAELAMKGDWPFQDQDAAMQHPLILKYLDEKEKITQTAFGENHRKTKN